MYKTLAFCFIVFLSSCSENDVPSNILSIEKMKPILWEQLKADIYTRENLVSDSLKNKNLVLENEKLQMQIFKHFNISKENFYESYYYYLKHENLIGQVLDTLIAEQTRANLELLKNQHSGNDLINIINIFTEAFMKPRPIFTLQPDTLPSENEIKQPNYDPYKKYNVPKEFNPK